MHERRGAHHAGLERDVAVAPTSRQEPTAFAALRSATTSACAATSTSCSRWLWPRASSAPVGAADDTPDGDLPSPAAMSASSRATAIHCSSSFTRARSVVRRPRTQEPVARSARGPTRARRDRPISAPRKIRTSDTWFRRPVLYPAELWAHTSGGTILSATRESTPSGDDSPGDGRHVRKHCRAPTDRDLGCSPVPETAAGAVREQSRHWAENWPLPAGSASALRSARGGRRDRRATEKRWLGLPGLRRLSQRRLFPSSRVLFVRRSLVGMSRLLAAS